jgi:DNA-binding ferritin-like protein
MKPDIEIPGKQVDSSIKLLSSILADEMNLYVKTRKFHWNVSGESFMELHKLFEGQYTSNSKNQSMRSLSELASWGIRPWVPCNSLCDSPL